MRNSIAAAFASLLFATAAAAQDGPVRPADAVQASLTAKNATAASDATVELELAVDVRADCRVAQTLLTGQRIEAWVGESKRHEFVLEPEGEVALLAGTRLTRPVAVDLKLVFGGDTSAEGGQAVTLRWPGLPGAEARVQVVPNQSEIDVAKLDLSKTRVKLVTSMGEMVLGFFPEKAPNHVRNFVELAKNGFYDNTQFHRVIRGFMIQGGCPNTKPGATGMPGTGDPGYKIDAEFNDTKHVRGILSAARSSDPNSAGCQFFLMHGEAPHLDGQYTAYGKLEEGFETLDAIATTRVGGPQRSTPVEPVHLWAAVVLPVYKE